MESPFFFFGGLDVLSLSSLLLTSLLLTSMLVLPNVVSRREVSMDNVDLLMAGRNVEKASAD